MSLGATVAGVGAAVDWTRRLVLVLALVISHATAFAWGWNAQRDAAAAEQLAALRDQVAAERGAAAAQAAFDVSLILQGARQDVAAEQLFRKLKLEIPDVTAPIVVERAAACPPCAACITRGFVRVWDHANAATVPAAAGGAAQAPARPDPAGDTQPAVGVDAGAVLANHVDNARVHALNRSQCERLMAWARGVSR